MSKRSPDGVICSSDEETQSVLSSPTLAPPSGANLRTYDLALVASAEFRNAFECLRPTGHGLHAADEAALLDQELAVVAPREGERHRLVNPVRRRSGRHRART